MHVFNDIKLITVVAKLSISCCMNDICRKLHVVILLSLLPLCGFAANEVFETPLDVYEIALKNDPVLNASVSAYSASIENVEHAKGGMYPEVNITARADRHREDVETTGVGTSGLYEYDSNDAQLKIKQPLFRKDLLSGIDIANAEKQKADYEFRLAQQDLIMRVMDAYFNVLSARNALKFAEAEKQSLHKQLQNIERRYKVGKSTKTDLQEATASHDLSVAQVIVSQDDYKDSLEGLSQLTGLRHLKIADLSSSFVPDKLEPANSNYWDDLAIKNNLQLQVARFSMLALKHEIEKQRAGHYPSLDLVAKYQVEDTGGRFGDTTTDDQSIGIELTIPVYKGGQTSSKVHLAVTRLNEARQNFIKTRRAVIRETRKAYRAIMSSVNLVGARKQAVISTESALNMIKKGYQVGTRTNADVFDAQREVYKAQRDFSADKYKYIINYLQIKHLTGSLTRDDVNAINRWFTQG